MEFDATFLFAVISFLVFIFIMNKVFYAPILRIMQERQKFVEITTIVQKKHKKRLKNNINIEMVN